MLQNLLMHSNENSLQIFIHHYSYTDLINADEDVRELLTKFVKQIKKIHRTPHVTENRILWLVNSIT